MGIDISGDSQMEYIVLNHRQTEQLGQYLPEDVRKKIETEDACVIGAVENAAVTGVGVFSYDEFSDGNVECLYLYTVPERRNNGLSSGLLRYAEDMFKKQGVKQICFNLSDIANRMTIWNTFLTRNGYVLLDMNWHILEYHFESIEQSREIQRFRGQKLTFCSLNRRQITYMLHEDKSIPYMIRKIIRNEADWQKSLFYSVQGHLAAGVMVRNNGADELSIHALYLSSHLKNRSILLVMLAQTVEMMKQLRSAEAKVYFYVENQRQIEAYNVLFGTPAEDYQVCRMEKSLM